MILNQYFKQIIRRDFLLKKKLKNVNKWPLSRISSTFFPTDSPIPFIEKIVLNTSSKNIVADKKQIIPALLALEFISGQKPSLNRSKKSIAAFKLRKNVLIGCKIDLHGEKMYSFLFKLITIILPRTRDLSFLSSFDKRGNLHIGINDPLLFPELEKHFEFFESLRGFSLTIITSTKKKEEARLIFSALGLPVS